MDLRLILVLVFMISSDMFVEFPPTNSLELADPPLRPSAQPFVPSQGTATIDLETVHWTTHRREKAKQVAERWGIKTAELCALNPGLTKNKKIAAGTSLLVYQHAPGEYSQSVGAPNNGKLLHGVPFPEGKFWTLRRRRRRSYGTKQVVSTLMEVFDSWGQQFPGATPILLGELSNRSGGRAPPHKSHRSGRDVDIGYVLTVPPKANGRWIVADSANFDAQANWVLIRGLIETGVVGQILVDRHLQEMMLELAVNELDQGTLAQYFSIASDSRRAQKSAFIRHWKGHDDHMHVRFDCSAADEHCVNRAFRRKSRKRRRKRSRKKH